MILKITKEKQIMIFLGMFLILIVLIFAEIIWPTISYIKSMASETTSLYNYINQKNESSRVLKISKSKIDEVSQSLESYKNRLFYREDAIKLIGVLEGIAQKNNLIQKIQNSDLDQIKGSSVHMSIMTSGSYGDSLRYLADLEKTDYFIQIQSLNISTNRSEQKEETIMNLDLLLYVNSK